MGKSQYIIKFGGLPVGIHEYEFKVSDTFFNKIETSEIAKANIVVKAKLTKQNNLLQMNFEIVGSVEIECDRCIKYFDFPIETEENLVIKHGNPLESTDDILIIQEGQEEFELSQYLYEYITLAIPARRVPCEIDSIHFKCDKEMLYKLDNLLLKSDKKSYKNKSENPIWEELNKIKKINKN